MTLVRFSLDSNGIGTITLDNPDSLNAMDELMAQDFRETINSIKSSENKLRTLILTGAGRAFSAGGNLQMLKAKTQLSKEENKKRMLDFYNSFLCMRSLHVPLIAAINGHAIGAGLCIACACDIRIASDSAKLGLTFTKLGLHPGMGATYFVPLILGTARAQEFLLTARVVTATDGLNLGLVNSVAPADDVLTTAQALAAEICACGPLSVRQLIQSLRGDEATLNATLEREAAYQAENYASSEFLEGVTATIEKRTPIF